MLLRLHGINLTPRKLHDTFSYCICSNKNYIFFFLLEKNRYLGFLNIRYFFTYFLRLHDFF